MARHRSQSIEFKRQVAREFIAGEEGRMLRCLERFLITCNHVIEKESLKSKELEQVRIEKGGQLF